MHHLFWNSQGFFICHDIKHGVCVQKQQKWYFIESTRAWCYYIQTGKFQKALQFAYSLWEINVARWQLVWQRRGLRLCGQTARLSLYKRLWCSVFSLVNTWRPLHVVISLTTTYILLRWLSTGTIRRRVAQACNNLTTWHYPLFYYRCHSFIALRFNA